MSIKYHTKLQLLKKAGWKCERCGIEVYLDKRKSKDKNARRAHFHHIIHRANGGSDSAENLLVTCWQCELEYHQSEISFELQNNLLNK